MSQRISCSSTQARQGGNRRTAATASQSGTQACVEVDKSGWISDLPENATIIKGVAKIRYRLTDGDLKDLHCEEKEASNSQTGAQYAYLEYQERDVETRAWEKYGGPIGLWHFLKCKLADYIEKHGNDHSFFPPRGYQRGHLYDLYIKDPPFVCDKYCYSSSVLAECKKLLSAQFWNECNKILDKIQPVLTSDLRAQAMGEAVVFFRENPVYAERPDDGNVLKGTSTLYTVPLTATLCAAPRLPPKEEDNSEEEIVAYPPNIRPRMSPNGPYCDWSLSYLERIFTKLIKVKEDVERFEGDKEVWKKLRWVVYDKVCSRICSLSLASTPQLTSAQYSNSLCRGLRYDPDTATWSDPAAEWLKGKMSPEEMRKSILREQCKAGVQYNKFLPEPSSAPSQSQPPSAGPSSAPM
ncbi:hypothetical protein C8Q76DRAFT_760903 [Earliella scabrosa]|nr:hypothetical protein C8Q76DRAFT_760903 [Earliella scabrosa]